MTDNEYVVKITKKAEEQLQEIVKYISAELNAPKAALNLLDVIENSISELSHLPQRISLIDDEISAEKGVRKLIVKNFLVYFWIDEENKMVQIIAIIYSKRDQQKQFLDMEQE